MGKSGDLRHLQPGDVAEVRLPEGAMVQRVRVMAVLHDSILTSDGRSWRFNGLRVGRTALSAPILVALPQETTERSVVRRIAPRTCANCRRWDGRCTAVVPMWVERLREAAWWDSPDVLALRASTDATNCRLYRRKRTQLA